MTSQCVHGVYNEKSETVQKKYSPKDIYKKDSKSTSYRRLPVNLGLRTLSYALYNTLTSNPDTKKSPTIKLLYFDY